jgi:hypothetical protein
MVCRHESCGNRCVTFRKEKTVKRVHAMLFAALLIAAGSATADPFADTPGSIDTDDSATGASTQYEVDEDRDGRTDRLLILEQSDSLA